MDEEKKERIVKVIRIAVALTLSLLAFFYINQEHFGDWGYGLNITLFVVAWLILGYDMVFEMIASIIKKEEILSENLLMVLASVGAFSLLAFGENECFEAVLILLFFQIGEMFEDIAKDKTRDALLAANELRSPIAHKQEGEGYIDIDPETIQLDDVLAIRAGELLPTDGVIISGEGRINAASLTGESRPIHVRVNDNVAAGTTLQEGQLVIRSTSDCKNNTVAKILSLIENSSESKSKVTRFIHKFAAIYVPVIFIVSILLAVIPPLFLGIGDPNLWRTWIHHGLCVLVIACPCSIVASIPLAYFAGMGLAGRKGILIKGAEVFDRLLNAKIVFSDKTGTLTKGEFKVLSCHSDTLSDSELLAIAKMCEYHSNHPIARALLEAGNEEAKLAASYQEIPGKGVIAKFDNDTYYCGNLALLDSYGIKAEAAKQAGTAVYLAKNNVYLGYILLGDETKKEVSALVCYLHKQAIQIHLLSGDRKDVVEAIAVELGLDGATGEATVEGKANTIQEAKNRFPDGVVYMGDGINDAASLAAADLAVAMGGIGSDLATENSDVILMNDNPESFASAHRIAKAVRRQSIFNIVLSLTVKLAVIVCSLFIPGFPLWVAVAADTGLLVLCVLLSFSLFLRKRL